MRIARLALLMLMTAQAFSQVSLPVLQGVVSRLGTNEPVARATVELRKPGGDPKPYTLATTDEGKFVFRNIPAGQYELAVTRPGYVPFVYGRRKASGPGEPITLPSTEALSLKLTLTASISGRITDKLGKPMANAEVAALKPAYNQGRRTLRSVQVAITNDLGEYRLFGLTPGPYYVSALAPVGDRGFCFGQCDGATADNLAVARRRFTVAPLPPSPPTERSLAVYFPGRRDPESAAPIDLRPGMDFRGVDMIAFPARVHHVRGVVVDAESNLPVSGSVQLNFANLIGAGGIVIPGGASTFDFGGALPGPYLLIATAGAMIGRLAIEVGDEDLNNVTVAVSSGFDIPGRMIVRGNAADANLNVAGLRVNAPLNPPVGGGVSPASVADGAFILKNVVPGNYRVNLTPALQTSYIESIRLGSSDVLNDGLRPDRQVQDSLEVIINTNGATLDGRVGDANQVPVKEATVALVPDAARRKRADLYKSALTDASGRFQLKGIAPGEYKLFAWDDVETGAWTDPEFLRIFENAGRAVHVSERSTQTIDLSVIPAQ